MSKNKILIEVELDEKKVPEKIIWNADADRSAANLECKAFVLNIFDKKSKDTLELDLWTKEMQVIEMDRFIFQSLNSMADMYYRATKNQNLANEMKNFIQWFGEQTGIINNENSYSGG